MSEAPSSTADEQFSTRIPLTRLRPLIKLDPDVQITAQDAQKGAHFVANCDQVIGWRGFEKISIGMISCLIDHRDFIFASTLALRVSKCGVKD